MERDGLAAIVSRMSTSGMSSPPSSPPQLLRRGESVRSLAAMYVAIAHAMGLLLLTNAERPLADVSSSPAAV